MLARVYQRTRRVNHLGVSERTYTGGFLRGPEASPAEAETQVVGEPFRSVRSWELVRVARCVFLSVYRGARVAGVNVLSLGQFNY